MKKKERATKVMEILNSLYPNPSIPLNHTNEFTLLIAVVLSAQCTDKKVNEVTKELFQKVREPLEMVNLGEVRILEIIKELGLFKQKAKYLYKLSKLLIQDHSGKVPKTFIELESLPGVGHKTASVVMSQAFNEAAFPVDTHIHRLAQRWELTSGKNVVETEKDLKKLFPVESWNKLHLQIIYYGREHCTARNCDGRNCLICKTLFPKRIKPLLHNKA